MRLRLLFAALAVLLLVPAGAHAITITPGANTVSTARFNLDFGNSLVERIDTLQWKASGGSFTPNLTANNGDFCGDTDSPSREWWGESYSTTDGGFATVAATSRGTWAKAGTTMVKIKDSMDPACTGFSPVVPVTTTYAFTDVEPYASTIKLTRRWAFSASTPDLAGDFRVYTPRLPIGTYDQVIWPNATNSALNTTGTCGTACPSTDWNGTWMALNSSSTGAGLIILRDVTDTVPGEVVTDNDGLSASNLSSVALIRPAAGWHKAVTETEYFCFYDNTSWPASRRSARTLPKGCAPLPALTLTPTSGPPNSTVKTKGVGYSPGETVNLSYYVGTTATPLGSVVADKFGAFTTNVTVPSSATPGSVDRIGAKGATSRINVKTKFTVTSAT